MFARWGQGAGFPSTVVLWYRCALGWDGHVSK